MTEYLPSPELLRKVLRYEPATGRLFWVERTPDLFLGGRRPADYTCSKWNGRYAGAEAFASVNSQGYRRGKAFGENLRASRVIWCVHYGVWPEGDIDHINGDRSDNRIENLRDVSRLENSRNQKRRANNTSGVTGVSWSDRYGKWQSQISDGMSKRHLGYFVDKADAVSARRSAEYSLGYHENHGRA